MRSRRARPRPGWLHLLGALALSCAPPPRAAAAPEVYVHAGVTPAELDPGALAGEPGLGEPSWNVGGTPRSASVWSPAARPRSVVVMLHGAIVRAAAPRRMDGATAARRLLRCLAMPAFEGRDALLIAPHGVSGQWWQQDDTAFVLGLVAAARRLSAELASRSVVTGYSNGGIAAWYFARLYPEWFSAAIPIASSDTIVGATGVPVYAIQGDKDELFPIEPLRAAVARARAQGGDVTLVERHRAGHMTPCAYAPELRAAADWLDRRVFAERGAEVSPSP